MCCKMSERLRNKYMEVLKERDVLLYDNKRIRHDYELYVRQNDQVGEQHEHERF